ncbi:VOC family protein [Lolliginicoccus suaedae]|uniref:VOC family protein n=1 Tax=Lolliginicoccus suaedae TaxID=2605429 RepID=UPI0011F028EF|nr:VOC family protein [Lolliginicoccus suaedae]
MTIRDRGWPAGTPCWADCAVDDVPRAREFYGAVMGWDFEETAPETGGYLIARKNGHVAAGIMGKPEGMEQMPSAWTTYLATDDVDAIAEAVTANGGQVPVAPMDVMSEGRMAIIVDPTGAFVGLWQPINHAGAALVNEPGGMCWNELQTRDIDGAKDFYAKLFGYTYKDLGMDEGMTYFVAEIDGEGVAGMMLNDMAPAEVPPMWQVYFAVEDCDKAVEAATSLGATILMPPSDSPYGRMSFVQSPQGETLGLVDMSTTVGEMPA